MYCTINNILEPIRTRIKNISYQSFTSLHTYIERNEKLVTKVENMHPSVENTVVSKIFVQYWTSSTFN